MLGLVWIYSTRSINQDFSISCAAPTAFRKGTSTFTRAGS